LLRPYRTRITRVIVIVKIEILPEDRVVLKPFLGLKPRVWLTGLYSLLLLVILFFLLVFPGLMNPGTVYRFTSEPWGAAVELDGVYYATTGASAKDCEVFAPDGKHSLTVKLPGFTSQTIEVESRGRVFASLFFPKTIDYHLSLESPSPVEAFREAAREYAQWALAGEPSASWHIPPVLAEAAYRIGPYAGEPQTGAALEALLLEAADFCTTKAALRDLLNAKLYLDNAGLSPSPLALLQSLSRILETLGNTPGSATWLASLLGGDLGAALQASDWGLADSAASVALNPISVVIPVGSANPGSDYLALDNGNYLGAERVSAALWEEYTGRAYTAPEPSPQNSGVPQNSGAPSDSVRGVRGITWEEAEGFCDWYTDTYLAGSGWKARLPSASEWVATDNGLWDWCRDDFAPLGIFTGSKEGTYYNSLSPEKVLRGGLWSRSNDTGSTWGSLPRETVSPFVSFRLLLEKE
jgi:hypothetical protein